MGGGGGRYKCCILLYHRNMQRKFDLQLVCNTYVCSVVCFITADICFDKVSMKTITFGMINLCRPRTAGTEENVKSTERCQINPVHRMVIWVIMKIKVNAKC